MTSWGLLLAVTLCALAVTLLVIVGGMAWDARRTRRGILERVGAAQTEDTPTALALFRTSSNLIPGRLDVLAGLLPHSNDLTRLLEQSGTDWRAGRFVLLTLGATAAAGGLGILFTGSWLVALPGALIGATLPWLYVRRRKAKRVTAFEELFPEAIDLLGRAIRAGHAFSTALKMVADEMDAPLGPEFQRVFEEQKFGLALEDSLAGLADRVDLADVRIFNTGVLIPRAVGGNLAEILDNLSRTIRERFTIQRQVRVYTAQGRFTGYLLAGLPLVLGLIIALLNRDYMSILWAEDIGRVMIAVALLLQVTGFFVIRRIVHITV